ncbi:MAG: hypothetical protein ABIP94_15640 [Planctomycetota bacterium]
MHRGRRWLLLALAIFAAVLLLAIPQGIGGSWRECDTQAISRNFLTEGFNPLRPRVDWRGDTDGAVECEFPLYQLTRGEISRQLRQLGFVIERTSYANCFLFPLAAMKRLKDRLLPQKQACSDVWVRGGWTNSLFAWLLRSEAPWGSRVGLPFGLTVVALARKPTG